MQPLQKCLGTASVGKNSQYELLVRIYYHPIVLATVARVLHRKDMVSSKARLLLDLIAALARSDIDEWSRRTLS